MVATLLGGVCRQSAGGEMCDSSLASEAPAHNGHHHRVTTSRAVGRAASRHTVPDLSHYIGVLPVRRTVMEMVKKVTVSLLDDLDGKAADETVQFALDGVSYEIDLSERGCPGSRRT